MSEERKYCYTIEVNGAETQLLLLLSGAAEYLGAAFETCKTLTITTQSKNFANVIEALLNVSPVVNHAPEELIETDNNEQQREESQAEHYLPPPHNGRTSRAGCVQFGREEKRMRELRECVYPDAERPGVLQSAGMPESGAAGIQPRVREAQKGA